MKGKPIVLNKNKIDIPLWPKSAADALKIQNVLRHEVKIEDDFEKLEVVAGVDCSFDVKGKLSFAFIVLIEMKSMKVIASSQAELPTEFPYIPGFLSFREIPVILKALEKLPQMPDFFMVDGQGVAHPRRVGIAAHLGVITNTPSIGVAKSRLCGTYEEPDNIKGASKPLWDKNEQIGFVLRSKNNVKPLFVSAGHRFTHEKAVEIVIGCLGNYRLPEPTRIADKISKQKTRLF
jgi:deoxyribonuclease V